MKVGDIVKWSMVEECYHIACSAIGTPDLTGVRKCGIIIDKSPQYFFVFWQNGATTAQKPNTIVRAEEAGW
jgi:hypothetical protein